MYVVHRNMLKMAEFSLELVSFRTEAEEVFFRGEGDKIGEFGELYYLEAEATRERKVT